MTDKNTQWLEAQIEALELELAKLREENKKLREANSNAGWAAEASRDYYDNGRDGWN